MIIIITGSDNLEQFLVELKETGDELMKLVKDILAVNSFRKLFMAGNYLL